MCMRDSLPLSENTDTTCPLVTKVHNQGKRTRLRDLIRYDMRQMHAAFTGTLPVGSKAENSLGGAQVSLASACA